MDLKEEFVLKVKEYRFEVCWWHNTHELMDLLRRVKEASEKKGLLLNTKQTKIMVIDKQSSGEDFLLDGKVIEDVSEFGYLGSFVNTKSDSWGNTQIGNCKNNL